MRGTVSLLLQDGAPRAWAGAGVATPCIRAGGSKLLLEQKATLREKFGVGEESQQHQHALPLRMGGVTWQKHR